MRRYEHRHDQRAAVNPVKPKAGHEQAGPQKRVLRLQRLAGNAAVEELLTPDRVVPREAVRSLEPALQRVMGVRLGHDLSAVRLHEDADATRAFSAHADTVGTDIVFAPGKYEDHRLAHELVHVVQQARGPVQGTEVAPCPIVSDPADLHERETNAVADQVPAEQHASLTRVTGIDGSRASIQRQVDEEQPSAELQTRAGPTGPYGLPMPRAETPGTSRTSNLPSPRSVQGQMPAPKNSQEQMPARKNAAGLKQLLLARKKPKYGSFRPIYELLTRAAGESPLVLDEQGKLTLLTDPEKSLGGLISKRLMKQLKDDFLSKVRDLGVERVVGKAKLGERVAKGLGMLQAAEEAYELEKNRELVGKRGKEWDEKRFQKKLSMLMDTLAGDRDFRKRHAPFNIKRDPDKTRAWLGAAYKEYQDYWLRLMRALPQPRHPKIFPARD